MSISNLARILFWNKEICIKVDGLKILGLNKPGFGIRGLALKGTEIEPELLVVKRILKSGDTFIDLGANTGIYSLFAAREVGVRGRVIAFEPNLEICGFLIGSAKINGFNNIDLFGISMGNSFEISRLKKNFNKPNSYSLIRHDADAKSSATLVFSLDRFIELDKVSQLAYVKIDVEGYEKEVITGMMQTILKFRPFIQFESSIRDFVPALDGYLVFRISNSPNRVMVPYEKETIFLKIVNELGLEMEN